MATITTSLWPLEPHSAAKHEILRRYLQAWIPILGKNHFNQVLYIDGFAGPGRYSTGELGSPIIALEAAIQHQEILKSRLLFLFIEQENKRAKILRDVISNIDLPRRFRVRVEANKTFECALTDLMNFYESRSLNFPPTFAFIDPFGWKGTPFSAISKIMSHSHCEVFVTFMYEEINRFLSHKDQQDNFDLFFGTSRWRKGLELKDHQARNRFLHGLYVAQLRNEAKAKYVRSFEMKNERGVTDYFLFYATNNRLGMSKMKEAMWKVDESGTFIFSDATDPNQLTLFESEPDFARLRDLILERFGNTETTIEQLEEYILAETPFRETHYKKQILRPLEFATNPPLLDVLNAPRNRQKGTYPNPELLLKFTTSS